MNKQEAKSVLAAKLAEYRKLTYADLAKKTESRLLDHHEIESSSGTRYQVDVSVVWDDKPGGDIRVLGSVDDGGSRAFFPLGDDFIIAPDGTFVDDD